MELTDFITLDFIKTFSGTLIAIELVVAVTKGIPIIKRIPTRIYTFFLTVIHLIIMRASSGSNEYTIQSCYLLFLNSIVISIILCGGYDTMINKVNKIKDGIKKNKANDKEIDNIKEVKEEYSRGQDEE